MKQNIRKTFRRRKGTKNGIYKIKIRSRKESRVMPRKTNSKK